MTGASLRTRNFVWVFIGILAVAIMLYLIKPELDRKFPLEIKTSATLVNALPNDVQTGRVELREQATKIEIGTDRAIHVVRNSATGSITLTPVGGLSIYGGSLVTPRQTRFFSVAPSIVFGGRAIRLLKPPAASDGVMQIVIYYTSR